MVRRHLSSDEQALWTALTRSVRPLRPGARASALPAVPVKPRMETGLTTAPAQPALTPPARTPSTILDSGWERRIRGGNMAPDMAIDLHGHSLAAAHARLNQALAAAWARDARVLLVVTGKPPKTGSAGGGARRGAIRGEIGHWLETSSYADRIASVRIAHQRHGGEGALYVILRRKK
ncbi:DNA mismatch repair protein MutS [Sphingobium sp. LB126]|uniref:Smr/MutS family protein n=1 Tax=Sphingobium sp. LB126 TaxID=1983755 RepID=UPI000C20FCC7|nr:Smr/MutS family protein [Sphingobium sp. LB126]PJG47876.1 DNA mismatch repair protein MutS [Sphingobium sp. LB126]